MVTSQKIGMPAFRPKLLCAAVSLSLLPIAGTAFAQDDRVEEVIVTGSFIRRTEGFRAASPVTTLTIDDIASQGTPNMGDVIQGLSFNQGTSISSNITPGSGATEQSVNIRGLGGNAVLDLLDGKRIVDGNTNVMLPQIAIQRLDIMVDGAAALYGSDAVAGVVNLVPIKSYDGFKFEAFNQQAATDVSDNYMEQMYSFLWGAEVGGWDIVTAAQWRDNTNLLWQDRPRQFYAGFNSSSSGNPGNFSVPQRDAAGKLTGKSATKGDAGCGTMAQRTDPTKGHKPNPNGTLGSDGLCYMDFGQWWELNPEDQQGTFYSNASYEASEDLSFNILLTWSSETYRGDESASDPGGRVSEMPTIFGTHPGNPFRAVNSLGQPLFARDSNKDTLPDRDASGAVVLDPNGIAFNEDVRLGGWRPIGKSQTQPAGLSGYGARRGFERERQFHTAFDVNFKVPYIDGWDGVASFSMDDKVQIYRENNQSFSAIKQGLSCDPLGPIVDCLNPFAVNPNVLRPYTNSQKVADAVLPTQLMQSGVDSNLYVIDVVLNGLAPLGGFELPGGPIAMAVGAHRRWDGFEYNPMALKQMNDQWNATQDLPTNENREIDAWFAEVSFPILDNLEFSAASRSESYSTGQSSKDPKFGITYSPFDWITVRGTKGTSFIAPGLNALYAPERCGLSQLDDPMSPFFAYAQRCIGGNRFLTPENANTLSAGITLEPIENLRIDIDWSKVDFSDRIVGIDPQQLLAAEFLKWQQATGISGREPTTAELTAWYGSPNADPRIIRDPQNLIQILRVNVGQSNASTMLVKAIDIKVGYRFELDAITGLFGLDDVGTMTVNMSATQIDTWDYQKLSTDPTQSLVGLRNRFLGEAPPLPEWKGDLRLGWVNGNHSANFMVHYIDEVAYDGFNYNTAFYKAFTYVQPFNISAGYRDTLRESTIADIGYNYSGLELFGSSVDLTVGSRNVFDRQPQRINDFAGMESELYDARGRLVYARITAEF